MCIMSQNSFLGRNWRLILNISTIVAMGLFLFFIKDQIIETFSNIQQIHWWVIVIIILLQAWNYHAQTRLYQGLFNIVGNKFKYKPMYIAAIELNFINNVFPSGGVSGISYFGARLRSKEVTAGKATLVQIMKLLLLYLSFEILLVAALFMLAAEGQINSLVLMVTVAVSTGLIIGTLLFAYVLGSKGRVEGAFHLIKRLTNKLRKKISKQKYQPSELSRVHFLMMELHENYKTIRSRIPELKMPLVQALLANLTEILCIYVIYLAFGSAVNLGAIILAYSVANIAGAVSVLPGGVGVYEALMTAVLVAAGVPVALSLPVTIMYRVLTSAIQIPPGYYFYHRAVNKKGVVLQPHA